LKTKTSALIIFIGFIAALALHVIAITAIDSPLYCTGCLNTVKGGFV
jgi:hypothetical protein